MRVYDLIAKKRNGYELSEGELNYLIDGYVKEIIPDYQMSAFLMAVYFQGMTSQETRTLTNAMINSGENINLSEVQGIKVDKHSTGGVGDKTTLILAPIVAAGGIPVAKMSGRGLGHTGGTIDKLESISGFNVEISKEQFISQVNKINIAITGQSGNLVPADKMLYSLRDVTATVDSIPLIASSIMSKKLAAGSDCILLDVKVGNGAFIQDIKQARILAETMVKIGSDFGKRTIAVLTSMEQPLGEAVGNSLEVIEALETLKGKGPKDLTTLCLTLAGHMFVLGKKTLNFQEGYKLAEKIVSTGKGLEKFKELIEYQNGNSNVITDYSILPRGKHKYCIKSREKGFIGSIGTSQIGLIAMELGAGREKKNDIIDYGVGILIKKKIGETVDYEETLVELIYNHCDDIDSLKDKVLEAFIIIKDPIKQPEIILDVIE